MQIPGVNSPLTYPSNQPPLNSASQSHKSAEQDSHRANGAAPTGNLQAQEKSHELSEDEQRAIEQLKVIDREVRAHEAAHLAAAGGLARGGASFSYHAGPDGRIYAVGGEVSIDTSAVNGNPQATIQKAQTIRAAALAPAQPSSADQAAAAAASQLEAAARIELAAQRAEEQEGDVENEPTQIAGTSRDASTEPDSAEAKTDAGINHYQNTSKPAAPSDRIGQLLNATA